MRRGGSTPRCWCCLMAVAMAQAFEAHGGSLSRHTPRRHKSLLASSPQDCSDDVDVDAVMWDDLEWRLARARLEERHRRSWTQRLRRYLSYDDASLWAQRMGIGSTADDWQRWVDLGEDWSTYVPRSPDLHYEKTGDWVSWQHFLCGDAAAPESPDVLSQQYFEDLDYAARFVPWDLRGRPQPRVCHTFAEWHSKVDLLDVGCGAGDNANWLAGRGHRVVGIDISAGAISTAIERRESTFRRDIRAAGGSADFLVASALSLDSSPVRGRARAINGFPVVLDSGLLHCFSNKDQCRYVAQLTSLVRTGGRLYIGCFSNENPEPWLNPRRISRDRLSELFDKDAGWRIVETSRTWWQRPLRPTSAPTEGGDRHPDETNFGWCLAWWCVVERLGAF